MIPSGRTKILSWAVLGCVLVFVVAVRVRLLDVPLERDEGEYAYMGRLLLEGIPPFSEAYTMKLPGTSVLYAIMMAGFGQTARGIHLGALTINCVSLLLVFLLARRFVGAASVSGAAAVYAVLSLSPGVLGFAAHATHFVSACALGGALLLHDALRTGRPALHAWSGLLFGLAGVMKQPGFLFLLFGISCVILSHFSARPHRPWGPLAGNLSVLCIGGALPLAGIVLWMAYTGNFGTFWFWTVEYAAKYGSQVAPTDALRSLPSTLSRVTGGFTPVWIMACCGIAVLFRRSGPAGSREFLLLFALFSLLTVLPGYYFRPHYFVTLLPALSLSAAVLADYLNARGAVLFSAGRGRHLGTVALAAVLLSGIAFQHAYLFSEDPQRISRDSYADNPFPESPKIAAFIRERTGERDSIAVFGSEPQIPFYAGRRSATGYLYTYGLMEMHPYALSMQEQMAGEIEQARPKFIVEVRVPTSWLVRQDSERFLFTWFDRFIKEGYTLTGIVDIVSPEQTVYVAGAGVNTYAIRSSSAVLIYERK